MPDHEEAAPRAGRVRVLWLSRHECTAEQRRDLEAGLGAEAEIVQVSETVASARRVIELLESHRCQELVAVLPVDILADLVRLRPDLRPIRAEMERRLGSGGDVGYRHRGFERIERLELRTVPLRRRASPDVLLTFLGTGPAGRGYDAAVYSFQGESWHGRFSGLAAAKLLGIGSLLVVVTPESRKANWDAFQEDAKALAPGLELRAIEIPPGIRGARRSSGIRSGRSTRRSRPAPSSPSTSRSASATCPSWPRRSRFTSRSYPACA